MLQPFFSRYADPRAGERTVCTPACPRIVPGGIFKEANRAMPARAAILSGRVNAKPYEGSPFETPGGISRRVTAARRKTRQRVPDRSSAVSREKVPAGL